MSKFNPDFWEVVVERAQLESFTNEDALWRHYDDSQSDHDEREKRTREVFDQINALIRTELTGRQRQVVQMYYFENRTQDEIAAELDIPQQVVSQHLFGVMRNGKRIGGAIPKLRKACEKRGIKW